MKEFENRSEFTPKYKSEKTSISTAAVIEKWEPATAICPKCGSKHVAINTMCVLTTYPAQYQYKCSNCEHRWTSYEVQNLGSMQGWPILEMEKPAYFGQMGWICPKCGRVYSPTTEQCLFCGGGSLPNIVYCGPNNGTKTILDNISISNTVDTSKINATQNTQSNNLKYESFKQQHGE